MSLPEMAIVRFRIHKTVVDRMKRVTKVARDALLQLSCVFFLQEVSVCLKFGLYLLWQLKFDVARYFVSINAVTVTNDEKMKALLSTHIWS